jgi:hypothetical protein
MKLLQVVVARALQPDGPAVTPSQRVALNEIDVYTPTCGTVPKLSLPVQAGAAQSVDADAGWHLPKPSQPAVHLAALFGQAAVGPAAAAAHVPWPLRLQA